MELQMLDDVDMTISTCLVSLQTVLYKITNFRAKMYFGCLQDQVYSVLSCVWSICRMPFSSLPFWCATCMQIPLFNDELSNGRLTTALRI